MKLVVFYAVSLAVIVSVDCRSHGRAVLSQISRKAEHTRWSNFTFEPRNSNGILREDCPTGFFRAGSSNQCYRLYNDVRRTWAKAKAYCESKNLKLAQPDDPVALRSHLVNNLGVTQFTWLGAQGNGVSQIWLNGEVLDNSSPYWYPQLLPSAFASTNCLEIDSIKYLADRFASTPYYSDNCENKFLVLCEQKNKCSSKCQNGGSCDEAMKCVCQPGWIGENCNTPTDALFIGGQRLTISTEKVSWNLAKERCLSQNARLAVLDFPEHFHTYAAAELSGERFWLGASDKNQESIWTWINDQPLQGFPWGPGQPDDHQGNEDCLEWGWQDNYNDEPCDKQHRYVCEHGTASCQCGILNANRIIGGTVVDPARKYPWQVGFVKPGFYFSCGGTIIRDRWILTAAHCLIDRGNNCELKDDLLALYSVRVGDHHQFKTSDDDSNTISYSIKDVYRHPLYNCHTKNYDVALLELNEAIPFNNVIRPICLPEDDSKTYAGLTGIVSGWGATSNGGKLSKFLQAVQVPILANDACRGWGTIADMKMCAGSEQGGKDFCVGDSGGPIVVSENNRYVQVGVVCHFWAECASGERPGIYTRVSKVLPWIFEMTANSKKCN